MNNSRYNKGPRHERAAQFAPFANLRGYYDCIKQAERRSAPRRMMTEEDAIRLSAIITNLHKGDVVRVTYYDTDAYVTLQGCVAEVVESLRWLRVIKTQISFDDISDIELLS